MTAYEAPMRLEDVKSVGTRIRWGAILAGGMLALGLYFLLGILGAAVGLSISDKVNPTTLTAGAIVWALLTTCAALFIGGMVASLFTVGENKVEAMMYGVIMWSLLFAFFVALGAAGVRTGFNAMVELSNTAQAATNQGWETSARVAGVPAEQIEEWRTKLAGTPERVGQAAELRKTMSESATRITWYAFLGMWLSMLAAAGGAVFGAGPTFRLVAVAPSGHVLTSVRGPDDQLSPDAGNGHRGSTSPAGSNRI